MDVHQRMRHAVIHTLHLGEGAYLPAQEAKALGLLAEWGAARGYAVLGPLLTEEWQWFSVDTGEHLGKKLGFAADFLPVDEAAVLHFLREREPVG